MNWILTHSIILVIIGLIELGVAIYFWRTAGDRVRRYFAVFAFGTATWVASVGLMRLMNSFLPYPAHQTIWLLTHFAFWGPVILLPSLLMISWLFPYPSRKIAFDEYVLFWTPIIVFGYLFFFTHSIVTTLAVDSNSAVKALRGPLDGVYTFFVTFYWLWAMVNLVLKLRSATGMHHWLLKAFIGGIAGSGVIGIFTNAILPTVYGYQELWYLGPEASIIWLGITGYVLVKK